MENIHQNPLVLKVLNGTMRSDTNLCLTCERLHHTIGAQTGHEALRCYANYDHPIRLQEPIASCTHYSNKNASSLTDMKEIAWTLMTDKGGRRVGFEPPDGEKRGNSPIGF